jgi:hypothetical protein
VSSGQPLSSELLISSVTFLELGTSLELLISCDGPEIV